MTNGRKKDDDLVELSTEELGEVRGGTHTVSSFSIFSVNGHFVFAPVPSPPPYIPQDPKSLSSAAVDEIVPSLYIVSTRDDDQGILSGVGMRVHNLSGDRALKLAEAFEAAAKQLRDPRNHDRVFDRKDPGVDIDLSAALMR